MAEEHKIVTVTDEGLKKMQEELDYLKNVKRKEVSESIGVARSFGDLSENSEYDEAKNEQAKVESQIAELEETLKHVRVVSAKELKTDTVTVGSHVKVYDYSLEEEQTYHIVGSNESDPLNGLISDQSPIGKAIIGTKQGDVVSIMIPSGEMRLKIVSIEK